MPSLRQTSATVRPLARSRSASRSRRPICSAVRRLLMSPSWTYPIRIRTLITAGPDFGEQATFFPWPVPVLLDVGDTVAVSLRANLIGEDYLWRWDTRVLNQGRPGQVKAE